MTPTRGLPQITGTTRISGS